MGSLTANGQTRTHVKIETPDATVIAGQTINKGFDILYKFISENSFDVIVTEAEQTSLVD